MALVYAGMTMSLDGFVADAEGDSGVLYPDLAALQDTTYMRDLVAATGAVVMGRGSYAMAPDPDAYVGAYEFQVPIFVVTHTPPQRLPRQDERLTFTFVTEGPERAVELAKAAAGDLGVTVVGGPGIVAALLRAGLVDVLRFDLMPVFLTAGKRLFDGVPPGVRLEKLEVLEVGERTSLRYRVLHP